MEVFFMKDMRRGQDVILRKNAPQARLMKQNALQARHLF